MLYDAKLIFADQKQALELDSKAGSAGGELDYSLLLDGLMAEREQGITIDVAYRYFTTESRSFIVADTPGHEEYTRNMAVGASFADLAVILVDATKGVLVQTRRHTRICSLMGIRDFVFAVNKMDLAGYSKETFDSVKREIRQMVSEFDVNSLQIIPVSAKKGDNINGTSSNTSWYDGLPLLRYLETINIKRDDRQEVFSLPIQRVTRPDHNFRGFAGQVELGSLSVGEMITTLPSGQSAGVKKLFIGDKQVERIDAGQPVTVSLDREIDISRGSVIIKQSDADIHHVGNLFNATILWTDDSKLVTGREYYIKLGTKKVLATIIRIKYKIDINSGQHVSTRNLVKNEIASCDVSLSEKIVFTEFDKCRELGGFIFIDRVTNATSACGTVIHPLRRSDNLEWQNLEVTRETRSELKGQKPMTIWMTGLSCSGKTSLSNAIEKKLSSMGRHTMHLDSQNLRLGLNRDLGFKEDDRVENIRRVAEIAKLMNEAGLIVLTSFISPHEADRLMAKEIIGDCFKEVYVSTPIEECHKRDLRGIYEKADRGEIPNFTGVNSPYEVPAEPDAIIDMSGTTAEAAAEEILTKLGFEI